MNDLRDRCDRMKRWRRNYARNHPTDSPKRASTLKLSPAATMNALRDSGAVLVRRGDLLQFFIPPPKGSNGG